MADLIWLAAALLLTTLFWIPYALNRMAVQGVMGSMSNPAPDAPPLADWAQRAKAAHSNAIENLAVFAPALIAASLLGQSGPVTLFAAQLYFFARLAHYVIYAAGVPVLRTLAFLGGWLATVLAALAALGMM